MTSSRVCLRVRGALDLPPNQGAHQVLFASSQKCTGLLELEEGWVTDDDLY